MKKKIFIISSIVLSTFTVILLSFIVWVFWGNTALELNSYTITNQNIPDSFNGFRIAQVSDLHNAEMGNNNDNLLTMLKDSHPNIIVITGDLIDSRNTDIDVALAFAKEAVKIAPCYYVTGNHEARVNEYNELKKGLSDSGVVVLEDTQIELTRSGETITLIGLNDPSFETDYLFGNDKAVMKAKLDTLTDSNNNYKILLSHRPELFDVYVDSGVDLVFSGHAHGGQFRLPFIGGLAAPNQGLFPEYDSGIYTEENTNMVVSRGIGNSIIPLRFNNRPEVILIEVTNK